jgi:hypothetical protein
VDSNDRYQKQRTMGFFIFMDCLIGLIILIRIHASWWAWLIYIVSVLVWFVIGVSHDGGAAGNTTDATKKQP